MRDGLMKKVRKTGRCAIPARAARRKTTGQASGRLAVVAGTFDMLQPGNLTAIRRAKAECGRVCMVVEPDESAPGRTLTPLSERAAFVSHLKDVDMVVPAASPAGLKVALRKLRPYTWCHCPDLADGAAGLAAAKLASKKYAVPLLEGCSTAEILAAALAGRTPIHVPAAGITRRPARVKRGTLSVERSTFDVQHRKSRGSCVVSVNGCFDVLHVGHARFLAQARAMGDELVVLVNDDESVRRYKGRGRPVFPLAFRIAALLALKSVDRVIAFGEDSPLRALSELRPAIHVKGGSFEPGRAEDERRLVESWGGRLKFCRMTEGFSTTALLKKAVQRV